MTVRLDNRSRALRRMVLDGLKQARRGHLGAALSLVEILRALYDDVLRYRPDDPLWADRDRLILSKGHGCLALYALLVDKGYFDRSELGGFCALDGTLGGHPERKKVPGVEATTGSLGHGLSIGVGMALAAQLRQRDYRVFVVVGDGECNEGAVWEAALSAAKHGLNNLTVIIDYNKQQSYGSTTEVCDLEPFPEKWQSFGWDALSCDGHDVTALSQLLAGAVGERPRALICHTVKGAGIAEAEHNPAWHHKNKISDEQLLALYQELGDLHA
ncbi:MAG: transketolase [Deltaproteobacteria bacterium]|nr:transketolase [Deltaproteobacteria bacterium]